MGDARDTFIRERMEAGESHDDIRRSLISHGFSTQGFEELYVSLGGEKPRPDTSAKKVRTYGASLASSAVREESRPARGAGVRTLIRTLLKIAVGVIVLAVLVSITIGYGSFFMGKVAEFLGLERIESTQSATDIARQSQMRTLQLSADIYRNKILDYGGVCKSIGIDESIYACDESDEAYAIETQFTDGSFYCIDSTGFAGTVKASKQDATSCRP